MHRARCDAWTRRRFGAAAAGLGALLSPLPARESVAKQNRKKRCVKLGQVCKQGGKRKCCKKLKCRLTPNNIGLEFHCCKDIGATCTTTNDCCSLTCIDDTCQSAL